MDLIPNGLDIKAALELYHYVVELSARTRYCMGEFSRPSSQDIQLILCSVAGYMWVLYDWFITLDQEVR